MNVVVMARHIRLKQCINLAVANFNIVVLENNILRNVLFLMVRVVLFLMESCGMIFMRVCDMLLCMFVFSNILQG